MRYGGRLVQDKMRPQALSRRPFGFCADEKYSQQRARPIGGADGVEQPGSLAFVVEFAKYNIWHTLWNARQRLRRIGYTGDIDRLAP